MAARTKRKSPARGGKVVTPAANSARVVRKPEKPLVQRPSSDGVWTAHDRAVARAREAVEAAQRIASAMAKQRAAIESVGERARGASARAEELAGSFSRVLDVFERLSLVALNAGLEGARLGESAGRALLLVSDEIRTQTTRGSESTRDLSATLADVGAEVARLQSHLEQARDASSDVAQEAARASSAADDAERMLVEMGERLRRTTGLDRDTSRAMEEAGEHARALAISISLLSDRLPRERIDPLLAAYIEPLTRLLAAPKRGARRA